MADETPDESAGRYEWERIVRRCKLPSTVKLVALTMATYASKDGTRIFPGVSRLAAVAGLSERSVRGALSTLRDIGLIRRVYKGGRHGEKAFTDVHHLAIPADLLDRVEMLPPEEVDPPNRQQMPVGGFPNRHETSSQPAARSSQPASDDTPTGSRCTPTPHRPSIDQNNYQRGSSFETERQDARARTHLTVVRYCDDHILCTLPCEMCEILGVTA